MRAILALDQGTTGSTALVVGDDGAVLGRGYQELPQYYPQPGWVEHDPAEIWATQLAAARAALARRASPPRDLAAIGITNQRETTLLWDRRTGVPVHRAIVWQCRRSAPLCERLRADGLEPLVRARTGLVLDAYFSGTKIAWLLEARPELRGAGGPRRAGVRHGGHAGSSGSSRAGASTRPIPRTPRGRSASTSGGSTGTRS